MYAIRSYYETETIEYSYGKPVVQYRGQLMPLIGVSEDFRITKDGRQPVLVFTDRDRSVITSYSIHYTKLYDPTAR